MSRFIDHSRDLAIPLGSLVLVTGISGMIAIHIADEALRAGFRVRGTVRTAARAHEVRSLLPSPDLEIVLVPEMGAQGAYNAALTGVSAVIHCASITNFSPDAESVIPTTVNALVGLLEGALLHPSVKRVVFTSTSGAASKPRPGVQFAIDRDSWNQEAVELVEREVSEDERSKMGFEWGYQVYVASKVKAERAAWRFVAERNPPFVVNVINPAMNWGKVMGSMGISGLHVQTILNGQIPPIPSVYMVDTIDDARIHVAAAIDVTVASERIFACDEPFTWGRVVDIIRRVLPDAMLPRADPDQLVDLSTVDNTLGARLLTKWWGQAGYKGLDQTIRETVEMCLERGSYSR
ncbi:NAD(P)-binding protein [Aspergillus uvarum CBS 121591]|uniref:NAD(P)-binding protein n=1 Tax=Aspergillus uvarum CBS 121591 TaxID=1448315 RepID=A0A319D050_9EURO|nr:NAD(P)-binding protein [Aspergillus uvarum CBS 121591]PYH81298.1 NAD(P)-binding protein [Aspergillus uvarum CBS 121591]